MGRFKIIDITEADFGCEEHLDGPRAALLLEDGRRFEVTEDWIAANKLEDIKKR